jgi:ribosomal protein S18 acetylase RimI-like enzyme
MQVQSGLRSLKPPVGDGSLLLGKDRDGQISAVALWSAQGGADDVYLRAIAVAARLRGAGGLHAREALDQALSEMASDALAAESGSLVVSCLAHEKNLPSQKLLESFGFECLDRDSVDEAYFEWTMWVGLTPEYQGGGA